MKNLEKNLSTLVNVSLVGLLIAGWAAARHPSYAVAITIAVVAVAISIAIAVPTILHVQRSKLSAHDPCTSEKFAELNVTTKNLAGHREIVEHDANNWHVLLNKWHSNSFDEKVLNSLIHHTLKNEFHHNDSKNRINIGIVNLIISEDHASIKLAGGAPRKFDKKPEEKINMVLRPDLMPEHGPLPNYSPVE